MPQDLQNFAKFQKFQLDNLADFENDAKRVFSCKNRSRYSRKRATFCRNFANRRSLTSLPARGPNDDVVKLINQSRQVILKPIVQRCTKLRALKGRTGQPAASAVRRTGERRGSLRLFRTF